MMKEDKKRNPKSKKGKAKNCNLKRKEKQN